MENLPFEICLKICQYLDLKSRIIFCHTYQHMQPFLYDKSLIYNLKIEEICLNKVFDGFWKNFPLEKENCIKILDISNINFSRKQSSCVLNFLFKLKSLKELRMISINGLQEDQQLQFILNNPNLCVLWVSPVIPVCPKIHLHNLTSLYIYFDQHSSYPTLFTMLAYIGSNVKYIWIEFQTFYGQLQIRPDALLNLLNIIQTNCPQIQEVFTIYPKNLLGSCKNLRPYSICYRHDGNRYYLFKKTDENSRILKHLQLPYPKLFLNSLNISHFEMEHVPIDNYDLSGIKFNEFKAFSSNVCRYYEANKRDSNGDMKHCSKFFDLINQLEAKCEHFELIGCNLQPSMFDESPITWNENALIHISKLHHLQSLNLYKVKFTNIEFLRAISHTCPLKTLKISIKSSTPNMFYNIASIVKDMLHLTNFYYEDVNSIVPNLSIALIPVRLSLTIQRYSLILKDIVNLKTFSKYNQLPINRHVKLINLRFAHSKNYNFNKNILASYFNDCTKHLYNLKYIVGSFYNENENSLLFKNFSPTTQEMNEILTSCTSVLDLERIQLF